MPPTQHRLFHVLVVLGAAATAAAACDRDPTKSPEPAPLEPASEPTPPTHDDRTADARSDRTAKRDETARDDAACTCEGEGPRCTADGVMCCWAHGDCCPTCCA